MRVLILKSCDGQDFTTALLLEDSADVLATERAVYDAMERVKREKSGGDEWDYEDLCAAWREVPGVIVPTAVIHGEQWD